MLITKQLLRLSGQNMLGPSGSHDPTSPTWPWSGKPCQGFTLTICGFYHWYMSRFYSHYSWILRLTIGIYVKFLLRYLWILPLKVNIYVKVLFSLFAENLYFLHPLSIITPKKIKIMNFTTCPSVWKVLWSTAQLRKSNYL